MYGLKQGAFGPSFHLCAVVLLAVLATATESWFFWFAAAAWLTLAVAVGPVAPFISTLDFLTAGVSIWLVLHTVFLAPVYRPEAIYFAVFVFGGYQLGKRLDNSALSGLVGVLTLMVLALAVWGLVQVWFASGFIYPDTGRAQGPFPSPNTLATLIGIALVVQLALAVERNDRVSWLIIGVFLAALWVTQSRSGLLATGVGIAWVLWLQRSTLRARSVGLLGAVGMAMVLTLGAGFVSKFSGSVPLSRSDTITRIAASVREGDTSGRLGLYRIAWREIQSRPLLGHGFLSFQSVYLQSSERVFRGRHTEYVHSDYLQYWLELGLLGLLGLLLLPAFALAETVRGDCPTCLKAAVGGVTVLTGVNAAIDFPLYVPVLSVLFAIALGRSRSQITPAPTRWDAERAPRRHWRDLAKRWLCLGLLVALLQPVAAQWSSEWGKRKLARGDFFGAQPWLALARNIAPYSGYHAWVLGVVWSQHAIATRDDEVAHQAVAIFEQGSKSDPSYVANELERLLFITNHREFSVVDWSESQILEAFDRLRRQWPNHQRTQLEFARALVALGQTSRAEQVLDELVRNFPGSDAIERLKGSLGSTKLEP